MRIFLDANILFSAAKSDEAVQRLLVLLTNAGHECWADGYVAEEARRNLAAKSPERMVVLEAILARLHLAQVHPGASDLELASALPAKDRPVLAATIRLKCDALVSGDRTHFGPHYGQRLGGVAIHSPASLALATLEKLP